MRITVTEEHHACGVAGDCGSCPVALAIQEATGRYAAVTLEWGEPFVTFDEEEDTKTRLPDKVYRWAYDFDEHEEVELPFSFDLPDHTIPSEEGGA